MTEERKMYDIIILGGGPAGYTAALYAARAGLEALVLERLSAGGQMALSHQIDNYPGFEEGIDGFTLADKMKRQAERFGARSRSTEVQAVSLSESPKRIVTDSGEYFAKTVVIATGANPRKLGLPAEEMLLGRGVGYCASCDGMFYRGKTVAVVGGGNTAASDAMLLSRVAKKVYLVHRRDSLRATRVYHEPLEKAENVELCWNCEVTEILHESRVTGLRLRDVRTGDTREISCDGLFISIGRQPVTEFLAGQLPLSPEGYILAGEDTRTAIPGVFAAGDVRQKALRQVVTAVADGAAAVTAAEEFLAGGL
ncbi:MAG: thioredoxin-disulfide reductase [Clostridia bacterium]|nr:thioredoxin-disulfide reductase [Clostridia bacterium]